MSNPTNRFEDIRLELQRLTDEIAHINAQPFQSRIELSSLEAAWDVIGSQEADGEEPKTGKAN
ncbi:MULTISPECIES: hypothetical protein [unclassified Sinorhizobium]|uniref:hypothetical protein n=1 Tax=unclassified Sinorhizobium TaxID=2613772 RepID=UPI003525FFF9